MSSLNSTVLRQPVMASEARSLSLPDDGLDPAILRRIREEGSIAYAAGVEEGRALGAQEAAAAATAIASAVGQAVTELTELLAEHREKQGHEFAQLALVIAEQVIGAAPPLDAAALAVRIETALASLDDETLTVTCHPDDTEQLRSALGPGGLSVAGDPTLRRGEAVISGAWGRADLTRAALLDAIEEALDELA